jgi:hypothetical protein
MLSHELLRNEGLLIVRTHGAWEESGFVALARGIDPYIERMANRSPSARRPRSSPKVGKVAAVSDGAVLSIAPHVASRVVKAELRHFDYKDREKALAWLRET